MIECKYCKVEHDNVSICVVNVRNGTEWVNLNIITKKFKFPLQLHLCTNCIPRNLRYIHCSECGRKMMDEWYTGQTGNLIDFACRFCLTDKIINCQFKKSLGVNVPALKWWNAWKEPASVFRKEFLNAVFRKSHKTMLKEAEAAKKS